jgi:SHS2 domain-containing protein
MVYNDIELCIEFRETASKLISDFEKIKDKAGKLDIEAIKRVLKYFSKIGKIYETIEALTYLKSIEDHE